MYLLDLSIIACAVVVNTCDVNTSGIVDVPVSISIDKRKCEEVKNIIEAEIA